MTMVQYSSTVLKRDKGSIVIFFEDSAISVSFFFLTPCNACAKPVLSSCSCMRHIEDCVFFRFLPLSCLVIVFNDTIFLICVLVKPQKDSGPIMYPRAPLLIKQSAFLLPSKLECPGTHISCTSLCLPSSFNA